ncbi:hypothetical protein Drose_19710 [Dactylosporangium roseum]|uniref:Uncharacterized protein n=1 Tax=Dactylosporangium roseum TaxID=47989 RepID=A0ABY5YXL1_9ACTN|nr:hypothetical protein [Dactylosporangium roseum]UWZ33540.1 hypothetical protein Drose_19710 [Dactylosporangium roseum]
MPPIASDIAAGLSRLRGALDDAADHPDAIPLDPSIVGKIWLSGQPHLSHDHGGRAAWRRNARGPAEHTAKKGKKK